MKLSLSEFQDRLKETDIKFKCNLPFEKISYARLGGICALVAYPKNGTELIKTVFSAIDCGIVYRIVGKMSNILPPDGLFCALLICTEEMRGIEIGEECISADCGVTLPSLAAASARVGCSCLEELAGIPGSVGGAVCMNAGAYGKEISSVLSSADVVDVKSRTVRTVTARNFEFSYRHSNVAKNGFAVISARFAFRRAAPRDIYQKMTLYSAKRRNTQPAVLPSLGSVFKRHNGQSAAILIDGCGMKGYRIGGAAVSEKHAGFIVNVGGATSADYKALVELIKRNVFDKYGVLLSEEIEYLA